MKSSPYKRGLSFSNFVSPGLLNTPSFWQVAAHLSGAGLNLLVHLSSFKTIGPEFTAYWTVAYGITLIIASVGSGAVDPIINAYIARRPSSLRSWLRVSFAARSFLVLGGMVLAFLLSYLVPKQAPLAGNVPAWHVFTVVILALTIANFNAFNSVLSAFGGRYLIKHSIGAMISNILFAILKVYALFSMSLDKAIYGYLFIVLTEFSLLNFWAYWCSTELLRSHRSPALSTGRRLKVLLKKSTSYMGSNILYFMLNKSELILASFVLSPLLLGYYAMGTKFIEVFKQLNSIINLRLYQRFCIHPPHSEAFSRAYLSALQDQNRLFYVLIGFSLLGITPLLWILNMQKSIPFVLIGLVPLYLQSQVRLSQYKLNLEGNYLFMQVSYIVPLTFFLMVFTALNSLGVLRDQPLLYIGMYVLTNYLGIKTCNWLSKQRFPILSPKNI